MYEIRQLHIRKELKISMYELYNDIVQKYYESILNYCYTQLSPDIDAAKDCTQEVFLELAKKIDKLNLSVSPKNWLYRVANIKVKAYKRKHPPAVDIEEISEMPDNSSDFGNLNVFGDLTEEEILLIKLYYGGEDKLKLAQTYGITLSALYSRMRAIKKKIKENYSDLTNNK